MKRRLQTSWKLLAVALVATMLWSAAIDGSAAPLDDAKAAGLIGERPDGFVAAVQPNPPPDIAAIVQQVNAKRRAAYEQIAAEENVSADQVGALAAEKIKRQAPSGEFFMSSDGTWAPK